MEDEVELAIADKVDVEPKLESKVELEVEAGPQFMLNVKLRIKLNLS